MSFDISSFNDTLLRYIDDLAYDNKEGDERVYLKPKPTTSLDSLRIAVDRYLSKEKLSLGITCVNNIPLTTAGDPDFEKLSTLPSIDRNCLDRLADESLFDREQLVFTNAIMPQELQHISCSYLKGMAKQSQDAAKPMCVFNVQRSAASLIEGLDFKKDIYTGTLASALGASSRAGLPKKITYIYNAQQEESISYAELYKDARHFLQKLNQKGIQSGSVLALYMDSNMQLVRLLWACFLGGIVALPIAPKADASPHELVKMFKQISAQTGGLSVIHGEKDIMNFTGITNSLHLQELLNICTHGNKLILPAITPDMTALILMTSGSTGVPKLVVHTNRTLFSRSKASSLANHFDSGDTTLNWFGLDHVGALVMFHIRDVVIGANQIHVRSDYILQAPLRWLQLISKHRVTVTWAPNFAFALIVDKLKTKSDISSFDMSSLRFILNGGESVNYSVAQQFMSQLQPYGLKDVMHPAWGMSETGSGITYADSLQVEKDVCGVEYTNIGQPTPGTSLRIVDEAGKVVPLGYSGQLHVKGPSIMKGYQLDLKESRSSCTKDGWFNTGDIAALTENGLYIIGRDKDLLIVNGVNYSTVSIEAEITAIDGVEPDCVCVIPYLNQDTQKDNYFVLIASSEQVDIRDIFRRIREKLSIKVSQLPSSIAVMPRYVFPKTTIGKIKKGALTQALFGGALDQYFEQYNRAYNDAAFVRDWFFTTRWVKHNLNAELLTQYSKARCVFPSLKLSSALKAIQKSLKNAGADCVTINNDLADREHEHFVVFDEDRISYDDVESLNGKIRTLLLLARSLLQSSLKIKSICYVRLSNYSLHQIDQDCVSKICSSLMKSLASEYGNVRVQSICVNKHDLDRNRHLLSTVINHTLTSTQNREVYIDSNGAYLKQLIKLPLATPQQFSYPQNTLFIITGGMGGIGRVLTKHLVSRYDFHILLLGRKKYREIVDTSEIFSIQQAAQSSVTYKQCDLADFDSINSIVMQIKEELKPQSIIIFHAAGHLQSCSINTIDVEDIEAQTTAKITGSLNLANLAKNNPEIMVVNFSSANGYYGGAAVSIYSAANAYQDALSFIYPGVRTIAWSMWNKIGMSKSISSAELSKSRGFEILETQQGIASLDCFMSLDNDYCLVGLDPSNRFINNNIANITYSFDVIGIKGNLNRAPFPVFKDKYGVPFEIQYLNESRHSYRSENMLAHTLEKVATIWEEALNIQDISVEDNFFDLGGHSLLIPSILEKYATVLEYEASAVDVFKYPTIKSISKHICDSKGYDDRGIEDIRATLISIWSELLDLNLIEEQDNFFDLGAHSLMLPEVQSSIEKMTGVTISLVDIFRYPNIHALASYIFEQISHPKKTGTSHMNRVISSRKSLRKRQVSRRKAIEV